ncbi:bifunctional diguanylate cyclase/phosphodiesterase [Legionella spiritensis]|nr:EAL domain-containing protein [Legionella spiritensis]
MASLPIIERGIILTMRMEKRFFQSKVARRIFLLFVLSTLIPMVILAVFQMVNLERQLRENGQFKVRQSIKSTGMALVGRLFTFTDQLNVLGHAINHLSGTELLQKRDQLIQLAPQFNAITVVPGKGKPQAITGEALSLPANVPTLLEGEGWITSDEKNARQQKDIYFVYRPDASYLLIGRVKHNFVWQFDIKEDALLWVLDGDGHVVYANTAIPHPRASGTKRDYSHSGAFDWTWKKRDYFVAYWDIFLKYRLKSKEWVVVLAEPRADMASQAGNLFRIFLPAALLALILIMYLSQFQIRRYMIPLEKLTEAARRVSAKRFDQPVALQSGDEFEELGEAFNTMIKRLNRQFQALSIMSKVDQAILFKPDVKKVIEIIFTGLKELVAYDVLMIGVSQQDNPHTLQIMTDASPDRNKAPDRVTMSQQDLEDIGRQTEIRISLPQEHPPVYMAWLNAIEGHFLIFPILHHHELAALVCLGFNHKDRRDQCNTAELHDIFNRVAVAFTHAEWEARLYYQAHYDDLTGLPNRLVLRERLNQALKQSVSGRHYGVLMFIDLDDFKDINDTMGHGVGDLLLKQVARTMEDSLLKAGTVARLGGDEFTVLLTDFKNEAEAGTIAVEAAERLLQALSSPFTLADNTFNVSASIGIVVFTAREGTTSDDLLKFADMSMYQAKESGKNCYAFFTRELEQAVQERNELLHDLHTAISDNQLRLYFQPKVDASENKLAGAEVLLRWQHPVKGLLSPDRFLPLAEDSDLIVAIGEWVIQAACLQIQEWQKQSLVVPPLAVNLAARHFIHNDLVETIIRSTNETGVDSRYLQFEITESSLINNFKETITIMEQLSASGFQFALDDFGTGYSSLSYLKKLPLHIMKIDQVFVAGLPENKQDLSIVRAIITLAKNLGLIIVAEGIETRIQSELLCEMGCSIQQGYYFSKPLPDQEFCNQFLIHSSL